MFRVREKLGKKYRDLRRQMPLASIAELEEYLQAARRDADTDFHQYAKNHLVKDVTGEHPVEAGWEEAVGAILPTMERVGIACRNCTGSAC